MNERSAAPIAIALALCFPTIATLAYFAWAADSQTIAQRTIYVAAKLLQFTFPIVWVRTVLGRPIAILRGRGGLGRGAVFGALVLIATLFAHHHWLRADPLFAEVAAAVQEKMRGLGTETPWKFAALAAFYSVVHSFLEEYYWRWFVFGQLRRRLAFVPAIAVSSVGFASHHVVLLATFFGLSWATVLLSLAVAAGGAFWAWLYERHGSLWGPWVSHLLVDAAIFAVGYDLLRGLP